MAQQARLPRTGRHSRPCHHAGGTSWTNYHADDIGILATPAPTLPTRSGSSRVAASPWRASRATSLAAVNMTIATDTCPQSMIEAMRWTAVVSKIVDRRTDVATAADVFNAATLNGAKALGRDDLAGSRLARRPTCCSGKDAACL